MSSRRADQLTPAARVLWALLAGALLGLVVGLLLQAAIQRTATPLPPQRAFWQLLLLAFAGGLAGFAISAVSALRAANPDPAYQQRRRPLRPSGRPRPPGAD